MADLVVSDMAPKFVGIASVDAAGIEHPSELAIDFAWQHLKPRGLCVQRCFMAVVTANVVQAFKQASAQVKPLKPKASRDRSSGNLLVGLGSTAEYPISLSIGTPPAEHNKPMSRFALKSPKMPHMGSWRRGAALTDLIGVSLEQSMVFKIAVWMVIGLVLFRYSNSLTPVAQLALAPWATQTFWKRYGQAYQERN